MFVLDNIIDIYLFKLEKEINIEHVFYIFVKQPFLFVKHYI